jgi:hypothetical protein
MKAAGNSDHRQDYQFVDGKPGIGRIFYKLAQQDLDGTLVSKGIRVVDLGTGTQGQFIVSPNPVRGNTIQITVQDFSGVLNMRLVDQTGKVLSVQPVQFVNGAARMQINNAMAPGMYFLQPEGKEAHKIIIQR